MSGRTAATLLLALGACGPPPAQAPAPEPAREAAEAPSPWRLQASAAAGAALAHADAEGRERLRIACRRNPADLWVQAPGLTQVGSEERLTLGAGDELAVLVVSQATPADAPMEAAGQLTAAWVDAMAEGRPVGVSYGASCMSLPPPPPEAREGFVRACRAALAG